MENDTDQSRQASPQRTVYIDLSDFFEYFKAGNSHVTGIQKVVLSLAKAQYRHEVDIVCFVFNFENNTLQELSEPALSRFFACVDRSNASEIVIRRILKELLSSQKELSPRAGDTILLAGCFWIYPHYDILIRCRLAGVRIVGYIHDLIQINQRHFVHADATYRYVVHFSDLIQICDTIFANSAFVAREAEAFIAGRLGWRVPLGVVRLAVDAAIRMVAPSVSRTVAPNAGREFVLYVSTIEIRKNHKLLLDVWKRLAAGNSDVPDLVFAGKWGWMVDDLRCRIERDRPEQPWLVINNRASDAALNELYRNSLFTIFPSLAEGWGIPVGESLANGTPCLASDACSIPEVGGRLVRYFDATDLDQATATVSAVLADRSALAAWRQEIARTFVPRTWSDFSEDLLTRIHDVPDNGGPRTPSRFPLNAGQVLLCGAHDIEEAFDAGRSFQTLRMARVSGWSHPERDGIWASEGTARLRFQSILAPGTPVTIQLIARVSDPNVTIRAEVDGQRVSVDRAEPWNDVLTVVGLVSEDGTLDIALTIACRTPWRSERACGRLCLKALTYIDAADIVARVNLFESLHPAFASA